MPLTELDLASPHAPVKRRPLPTYHDQLARFRADLQPALHKFAELSKAHADLLTSFPAVAISLVTTRLPARKVTAALKLVKEGKPLTQVSAALNLPMWMRRMPPEALHEPLPANLNPNDAGFGRVVNNAAPPAFKPGTIWLQQVLAARALGDDAFAAWFAPRCWDALRTDLIAPLAAFAWFSTRATLPAHRYLRRRWSPRSPLAAMAYEAHIWHVRMILELQALETEADALRLTGARYNGYEFIALETATDLTEEGRAMGHCVADYAERAAVGFSRLFSIRKGEQRFATMEIRFNSEGAVGVEQLSGPRNRTPDVDVLRAAYGWAKVLCATPGCAALYGPPPIHMPSWQIAWLPYVAAKASEGVTITPPPADAQKVLGKTRELMAAAMHC